MYKCMKMIIKVAILNIIIYNSSDVRCSVMNCMKNMSRILIPNDLMIPLVNLYRFIGRNELYAQSFTDHHEQVMNQTIERDTYFLGRMLRLNITDPRMRLIITKDSSPRNKEETVLFKIKEVLYNIHQTFSKYMLNSADILAMLNHIYSQYNQVRFEPLNLNRKMAISPGKSKRVIFDETIAEYTNLFEKERYERIILSIHFFIDMYNIKPFTEHNELASFLTLYTLLLRSGLDVFTYVSLFEMMDTYNGEFLTEVKNASFNWEEGYSQTLPLMRFMVKMINESYKKLDTIHKEYAFDQKLRKSDNIEATIYRLTDIFSKDDIRLVHPFVSESTINRALAKLKEEEVIKPLGKGRSAKWMKIIKDDDYSHLFKS